MRDKPTLFFLAGYLFLASSGAARQGVATTPVEITVVDPNGAVIAQAVAKLVPPPTDVHGKAESDDRGHISFDLPAGSYELSVSAPGFQTASQHFAVIVPTANKAVKVAVKVILQVSSVRGTIPYGIVYPGDSLVLQADGYHEPLVLPPAEFRSQPHVSVKVHNANSSADETYSGVSLATLLARVKAPMGKELRGGKMTLCVVAAGSDGYAVVLSLAEIDPDFHANQVMVADTKDGQPLGKNGPFQLIVPEDKRPARWVHNLVSITLQQVH